MWLCGWRINFALNLFRLSILDIRISWYFVSLQSEALVSHNVGCVEYFQYLIHIFINFFREIRKHFHIILRVSMRITTYGQWSFKSQCYQHMNM